MSPPPAIVVLPAALDLNTASALRNDIFAHASAPLDLDASRVERVGGLCLQVLISATVAWREAEASLRVTNPSQAFQDDVRSLGAANLIPAPAES